MGSKKFTRWIDVNNRKIGLKIAQKYYPDLESGISRRLYSGRFLLLYIRRLFLIFLSLFRFNRNPYPKYFQGSFLDFIKRILGFYMLRHPEMEHRFIVPEFRQTDSPNPKVSIVICVFNNLAYTKQCLFYIQKNTRNVPHEVFVVNDKSTDETELFLKQTGVNHITNEINLGFLRSCNLAAQYVKGQYICFLNNDTIVLENWLTHLLLAHENEPHAGLVGAKLIYPYGLLQEAGGIVNNQGQPANYGRFDDPELPKYNYIRETDYCSGACILLTKEDFLTAGAFDEQFAPAYYEDTDLCFKIRHVLAKRVIYQPLSVVIHFEGISSGKIAGNGNAKAYQKINAAKFLAKWNREFVREKDTNSDNNIARRFAGNRNCILFIDAVLPEPDRDSGSRRIVELMRIFKHLGFDIIFLSHQGIRKEPYYSSLINSGVRVIYGLYPKDNLRPELQARMEMVDIAWVCRYDLNVYYKDIVTAGRCSWIFDTVDLHYIRETRALISAGSSREDAEDKLQYMKKAEISIAAKADLTIAITNTESEIIKEAGVRDVAVIPNIHTPYTGLRPGFKERHGICFIGSYLHPPNIDGVKWLVSAIMPLVWKMLPDVPLTLLGSNPTAEVTDLASQRVTVTGYLEDVSDYFRSNRVFVAPLRYGAGMKGKVGHALEYYLPVVTTPIGAEGIGLQHEHTAMIADDEQHFADYIIRLYTDEMLWNRLSDNSSLITAQYSKETVEKNIVKMLKQYDLIS